MNDGGCVFDSEGARTINRCRQAVLERLWRELPRDLGLKTVVDAGCGIGHFSQQLASLGLSVTAFDAREENIQEARRRYAEISFLVMDIEDPDLRKLGEFDCAICFGLLYHLENPFLAIRNVYAITAKILIIESVVAPYRLPTATLVDEGRIRDQALNYIAFVPSEAAFVKMLYRAGFAEVYRVTDLPDHEEFRATFLRRRRRAMLVASKSRLQLQSSVLRLAPEPHQNYQQLWRRGWRNQIDWYYRRIKIVLGWLRRETVSRVPVPVRLPWGSWWVAWNDVMGRHIRFKDDFEKGEQSFLLGFLQPGMVVLDIGAHQGLYTLLASREVVPDGQVISFEPSPRELRRLRWNLRLNRCPNVRMEPLALGSDEDAAELFVCLGRETGCNSLRPPTVSEMTKPIKVSITTLDNYCQKAGIDVVDFVKLDVEGAEMEVLRGARRLLSQKPRPVIMCELADIRTEPWGYRSSMIYEDLAAWGYHWFSIAPDGRLEPCHMKESFHENLLAVPYEKLDLVAGFVGSSGE